MIGNDLENKTATYLVETKMTDKEVEANKEVIKVTQIREQIQKY